jgi:sugar-specific transcriptional regulator TrmB
MLGDVLGLAADEAEAYRELVGLPSTTAAEFAARTGVPASDAIRILTVLEQRGLAARSSSDTDRFVASPPSVAVGALLVQRQNEMRLAELELSSLDELYRTVTADRGVTDVVDVVRGPEAIRQRFEQLQLGAREEVLAFVKPPVAVVSTAQNTAENDAVARGVQYRVVLERGMFEEEPDLHAELARATAAGEQVKVADSVPLKMTIVDREFAFVPVVDSSRATGSGALLVHASGLLDALVALFEAEWAVANRFVLSADGIAEAPPTAIDDLDAQVLSLLLAGLTDQAVANQLHVSLRTIQRRVQHLMGLARVETRMQLGWKACRLGWV